MSEQANFILWQLVFWLMPFLSGIIYICLCKKGYFEDEDEAK